MLLLGILLVEDVAGFGMHMNELSGSGSGQVLCDIAVRFRLNATKKEIGSDHVYITGSYNTAHHW